MFLLACRCHLFLQVRDVLLVGLRVILLQAYVNPVGAICYAPVIKKFFIRFLIFCV